jgi:hypothetical protein
MLTLSHTSPACPPTSTWKCLAAEGHD